MTMFEKIGKEKQVIAYCEKSLALEKIKKRRADTRHKIELGGLVIKSGMASFDKAIILGALKISLNLLNQDENYNKLFRIEGNKLF
ncbi:conjugal transfer protein TraD [Legionella pneumophila serogroup 1]|uniref:conjugal transfer protein TraD n=1 Tax=Legionella pneumophila TaxID=446 RepID=UPI000770AC36|nr:conjugal transfer protein TraD [Legionella pneumophila]QIB22995.1 conjugal transfer protein TraD [Legionella pneumophila]CZG80306.1 conjugal transfer protein TraD [Legionella pneumophila]